MRGLRIFQRLAPRTRCKHEEEGGAHAHALRTGAALANLAGLFNGLVVALNFLWDAMGVRMRPELLRPQSLFLFNYSVTFSWVSKAITVRIMRRTSSAIEPAVA